MAVNKPTARPATPAQKPAAGKPAAQPARPAAQSTQVRAAANPPAQKPAQQKPQEPSRPAAPATPAGAQQGQVARPQNTAVTARGGEVVPDYLRGQEGSIRGSENVEMQDLVIPRIELVQALSKCLIEGGAEYIPEAAPGMFYNSVTRQLYGKTVLICPVFFKKQYLCWKDLKKGGGFGGAFDSMQEAQERIGQEDDAEHWEPVETAQQIVLVLDQETGETSEAVLSCARTKLKVSRQLNSLIRMNGFDRFSRLYELFGVDETNNNNQMYKNVAFKYVAFAPVEVYKAAEALYNGIASGQRAVKIDDEYIDADTYVDGASGAPTGDSGPSGEY